MPCRIHMHPASISKKATMLRMVFIPATPCIQWGNMLSLPALHFNDVALGGPHETADVRGVPGCDGHVSESRWRRVTEREA